MRFKRITVENFGPFKNRTSIDFTERNGVSIVWGRNGRGKTTLLNAFNFVLNGTVKDRDGNVDNFLSFINEAGMDEGKGPGGRQGCGSLPSSPEPDPGVQKGHGGGNAGPVLRTDGRI